jgi:hypothetical protein
MDRIKAEQAIKDFKFYASPSSGNQFDTATVGDIKKLIDQIAKLAESLMESIDS